MGSVQILAGMKLWLLIIGTILVYITVSSDAKSLNGDMVEGNPTRLVEENEGMVRVKREVGGRRRRPQRKFLKGRPGRRPVRKRPLRRRGPPMRPGFPDFRPGFGGRGRRAGGKTNKK